MSRSTFAPDHDADTASLGAAKIVLVGPVGAGKTSAIRAITDGAPISTEVPMSQGATADKNTTTVALDFSSIALDDGTPVFVYGLPGQEHYAFMRPIILKGALGAIILLDARRDDLLVDCRRWLDSVTDSAPDAVAVVGVTHTDLHPGFSLAPLRAAVRDFSSPVAVFTLDARDRQQTRQLMRALIVSASAA
jgi:signal recognition particle receptor subunit beta